MDFDREKFCTSKFWSGENLGQVMFGELLKIDSFYTKSHEFIIIYFLQMDLRDGINIFWTGKLGPKGKQVHD